MKLTFVEQPEFARARDELLGRDEGYRKLQNLLMNNPRAGDVIQGTNGFRKLRIQRAAQNRGKSAGIRVIYLYVEEQSRVVFYFAYAKNEVSDLTPAQKKALSRLAREEKENRP